MFGYPKYKPDAQSADGFFVNLSIIITLVGIIVLSGAMGFATLKYFEYLGNRNKVHEHESGHGSGAFLTEPEKVSMGADSTEGGDQNSEQPAVLRALLGEGDEIIEQSAAAGGLTAWVIRPANRPAQTSVFYTTRDGSAALYGQLFDLREGALAEHTLTYMQEHQFVADLDAQWENIVNSHWLADGAQGTHATRVVYGFFDANCVYCHLARLNLKPYMEKGLQVRWIPVAILAENSTSKAAALFAQSDVSAAMEAGQQKWKNGEFDEAAEVSQEVQDKLAHNLALMSSLGANGTPSFFYQDAQGRAQAMIGLPKHDAILELTQMEAIDKPFIKSP